MPTVPGWILNMAHTTSNLVDDSPEFRQGEQKMQANNMLKATKTAMNDVEEAAKQQHIQEIQGHMAQLQDLQQKHQQVLEQTKQQQAAMEPKPEAQAPEPMTWDEQGMPKSSDIEQTPPQEQDHAGDVQMLSQATGLPPQVVASMALLGKQLGDMYPNGASPDIQTPGGPPAAPMAPPPPTLGPPPETQASAPPPAMPPPGAPPAAPPPMMPNPSPGMSNPSPLPPPM